MKAITRFQKKPNRRRIVLSLFGAFVLASFWLLQLKVWYVLGAAVLALLVLRAIFWFANLKNSIKSAITATLDLYDPFSVAPK